MEKKRLIYLLEQYANNADSPAERKELQGFLEKDESREPFTDVIADFMSRYKARGFDSSPYADLSARALSIDKSNNTAGERPVYKSHLFKKWYWAAASIVLVLAVGAYFILNKSTSPELASSSESDINAPQTNRAVVRLANGKQIFLDSIGNGPLAQQGNVKLVKLANGQIAYQSSTGGTVKQPQYNTLTNPRGSKVIDIGLSDGSHVWLNAGSSLTYPVPFTGNERTVDLQGEGYFEVAKDKSRKFIVSSEGVTTEVLGTHFNVHAYSNEPSICITLLEGSVRTSNKSNMVVIKPGQQAVVQNGSVTVNPSPDLDQVMAWKNGYFSFDGLSLQQAMIQLERWYDIDVVYEGHVDNIELVGNMTRDIPLDGLMVILQKLGVHYTLEGRKLTIKP